MRIHLTVVALLVALSATSWAQPVRPACRPQEGPDACRTRCEGGSQQSCAVLGIMHLRGEVGDKPDYAEAERLLRRACSAKVALGCGGMGSLYGAIRKDVKRARRMFERACAMGDALSCESLGGLTLGVDRKSRRRPSPADLRKAYGYYRRACNLGSGTACGFAAALIVDGGARGTAKEAFEMFVKACNGGMNVGCRQAVDLLNRDTPESRKLAAGFDASRLSSDLLTQGCKLGDAVACSRLNGSR